MLTLSNYVRYTLGILKHTYMQALSLEQAEISTGSFPNTYPYWFNPTGRL